MPGGMPSSTVGAAQGHSRLQGRLIHALLCVLVFTVSTGAGKPAAAEQDVPVSAIPWGDAITPAATDTGRHNSGLLAGDSSPVLTRHSVQTTAAQAQKLQQHLLLQQRQLQQQEQTPAQRAVARWYAQQRQAQELRAAGHPLPQALPAAASDEFVIPVPPPGTDVPAETQMPLYSPDQLRISHKLIPGVLLESQVISLAEQMQQAAALKTDLDKAQLEGAYPLLGPNGAVTLPERSDPSEYPDGYMAICAIVKNQHRDIREWLEYHRWLGIKKVYLYDNNSTVPLTARITDFMQSGFVEYAFFTGMQRYRDLFRTSSQWWAYNDCIHRFRHRHRWMGFIDADEFIVLQGPEYNLPSWQQRQQQLLQQELQQQASSNTGGSVGSGSNGTSNRVRDINTFMQQYEQYGGLAVNWIIFGSSGHKSRPHGGVLVNYHACLPDQQEQNTHVKVIANTQYLMTVGDDPHRVYYNSPAHFTVNELGEKVTQARTNTPSHTKIALHHYLTKSEGEYMQKMRRGSAAGNYKSPEFFQTINQYATGTCTRAIPLGLKCCPSVLAELGPQGVQEVKQRLAALQQAAPGSVHSRG